MRPITVILLLCTFITLGTAQKPNHRFYLTKTVKGSVEAITPKVKEALKQQGFGIITEVNMQKTFKEKLNVQIPTYMIYGVCNAKLAHQLLKDEANSGVLLPCKMVIKQKDDHHVEVVFIDPEQLIELTANPQLAPVGQKVKAAFQSVLNDL